MDLWVEKVVHGSLTTTLRYMKTLVTGEGNKCSCIWGYRIMEHNDIGKT